MSLAAAPRTIALSSSLRTRSAEESLPLAAALAASRGVVRVIDITWLDKIGIPVYTSVRPDAHKDSLCVHAGKGCTAAEARIGAYMEGIEFSYSPPGRSPVAFETALPHEIVASYRGQVRFLDFCPRIDATVAPDERLAVVTGDEICAGLGPVLVPAELVYCPFPGNPGQQVYGTSTNGLASGNSLEEATVHALAEVVERDVTSFNTLGEPSRPVVGGAWPAKVRDLVERIERAGLACVLRFNDNPFGLPHFSAYVVEPEGAEYGTLEVSAGIGCHPNSDIAAVRAIAEAVQSRVTVIHGGRDDLMKQHRLAGQVGADEAQRLLRRSRAMIEDPAHPIRFDDIPSARAETIGHARDALFDGLRRAGLRQVVRVVFTTPDDPFQVLRVVVPGAEFYEHALQRVGPRLMAHFKRRAG